MEEEPKGAFVACLQHVTAENFPLVLEMVEGLKPERMLYYCHMLVLLAPYVPASRFGMMWEVVLAHHEPFWQRRFVMALIPYVPEAYFPTIWRQIHQPELRQAYLQRIDEALDFLRTHGLAGTAKCAAAAVMNCLDEAQSLSLESEADMVVQRVSDAWAGLAAHPAGDFMPHVKGPDQIC